jgi:hypothetical protein
VLEIGAGSGYAAAVISRIADGVYAIERHDEAHRPGRRMAACVAIPFDEDPPVRFDRLHIHVRGGVVDLPIPADLLPTSSRPPLLLNQNRVVTAGLRKASNTSATGRRTSICALAIGAL